MVVENIYSVLKLNNLIKGGNKLFVTKNIKLLGFELDKIEVKTHEASNGEFHHAIYFHFDGSEYFIIFDKTKSEHPKLLLYSGHLFEEVLENLKKQGVVVGYHNMPNEKYICLTDWVMTLLNDLIDTHKDSIECLYDDTVSE